MEENESPVREVQNFQILVWKEGEGEGEGERRGEERDATSTLAKLPRCGSNGTLTSLVKGQSLTLNLVQDQVWSLDSNGPKIFPQLLLIF